MVRLRKQERKVKPMIELQILSPLGIVFSDSVDEIIIPTEKGEIAILTDHIPIFSKLLEGTVTIKKGAKTTVIAVIGGFIEVKKNTALILSDHAIPAESIQVAKAMEAKKRAEELIANKESNIDILIAEKELQKAIMELKVAEKIKHHI